jgi:hypothetical protein
MYVRVHIVVIHTYIHTYIIHHTQQSGSTYTHRPTDTQELSVAARMCVIEGGNEGTLPDTHTPLESLLLSASEQNVNEIVARCVCVCECVYLCMCVCVCVRVCV